jgi:hypothetical protein
MARFIVEVPHEPEKIACARAVQVFLNTGSHFLTHADWGCLDGQHCAWMVIDADSKEAARNILPPAFRSKARIVKLNYFVMEEIDEILRHHRSQRNQPEGQPQPRT